MSHCEEAACVQLGDYVVIQRQKYTKLQKFGSLNSTTMLGKEQLELSNILNCPYNSTFKMCSKGAIYDNRACRGQRLHTLEICSETELRSIREVLGISASGSDNRDICDNGNSQALKPEDIQQLRKDCSESSKIIEKIVENSKTFHAKTEYSQDKYLKKKEKKYFEYVQIRQPTIRLLADVFYRQDAEKVMGIRFDTLSQIISYSGVSANGSFLLFESGTNGLLPAALLNSIGNANTGTLVHLHPGNVPQKQALLAIRFPQEQLQRCISVNIYSVLREYYQSAEDLNSITEIYERDRKHSDVKEPKNKKRKLDSTAFENDTVNDSNKPAQKWQIDNKRACSLMANKFDSLVIAAKEHPLNLLKELLPLLKPSRPIVVFSLCKEMLMDVYIELKATGQVTNLHLISNWLRLYQILPNRTHPEVNMNGNSGYILIGCTLKS